MSKARTTRDLDGALRFEDQSDEEIARKEAARKRMSNEYVRGFEAGIKSAARQCEHFAEGCRQALRDRGLPLDRVTEIGAQRDAADWLAVEISEIDCSPGAKPERFNAGIAVNPDHFETYPPKSGNRLETPENSGGK